jgi:hypothetical protein
MDAFDSPFEGTRFPRPHDFARKSKPVRDFSRLETVDQRHQQDAAVAAIQPQERSPHQAPSLTFFEFFGGRYCRSRKLWWKLVRLLVSTEVIVHDITGDPVDERRNPIGVAQLATSERHQDVHHHVLAQVTGELAIAGACTDKHPHAIAELPNQLLLSGDVAVSDAFRDAGEFDWLREGARGH